MTFRGHAVPMTTPWFGLHLPLYTFPDTPPERLFDRVVEQARAAEAAGFWLVTVMDHLNQIPGVGAHDEPMLEAWSVLAALARETKPVRLGHARDRRHLPQPGAARQDRDDARRDLGRAGHVRARRRLVRGRARRLRVRRSRRSRSAWTAWTRRSRSCAGCSPTSGRRSTGRYYQARDVINVPRPVQPGGPPIMVGGGGEQRTLRIAAKHADMTALVPARARRRSRARPSCWRGYCEAIDRDPAADRADDGGAGHRRARRRPRREAMLDACSPEDAARDRRVRRRRSRPRRGSGRTSTPASPASRSTTPCTARPSRSRSSASCCALRRRREAVPVPRGPRRRSPTARRSPTTRGGPRRSATRRLVYADHLVLPFGFVPLLTWAAAATERIRVAAVRRQQRPPPPGAPRPGPRHARRARRGGRVEVAIGAGWNRPEYDAIGHAVRPGRRRGSAGWPRPSRSLKGSFGGRAVLVRRRALHDHRPRRAAEARPAPAPAAVHRRRRPRGC